jgi:hypothetical protein
MCAAGWFSISKVLTLAALGALGLAARPAVAEAQARGTLQATAIVVDTRPSFEAIEVARTAIQAAVTSGADSRTQSQQTVVTVARTPSALVVTIDYARN